MIVVVFPGTPSSRSRGFSSVRHPGQGSEVTHGHLLVVQTVVPEELLAELAPPSSDEPSAAEGADAEAGTSQEEHLVSKSPAQDARRAAAVAESSVAPRCDLGKLEAVLSSSAAIASRRYAVDLQA